MKPLIRKLLKSLLSMLEQTDYSDRNHIRTDKSGHAYYIKDIAKYHGSRRVALQAILDQMARGIDNASLVDLLGKCSQKIMAGDRQGAVYAIANIKARTADITNQSLLYRAALICILAEGEPDEYSADWATIKEQRWAKDEDSRFFFYALVIEQLAGLEKLISGAVKNAHSKLRRKSDDRESGIELNPQFYVAKLFERENELLYDLAKKQVYSIDELEEMKIGDFYQYLGKELKDSSELIKNSNGNRDRKYNRTA